MNKSRCRKYMQTSFLSGIFWKQNHCGHELPFWNGDCLWIKNQFCESYGSTWKQLDNALVSWAESFPASKSKNAGHAFMKGDKTHTRNLTKIRESIWIWEIEQLSRTFRLHNETNWKDMMTRYAFLLEVLLRTSWNICHISKAWNPIKQTNKV